MSRPGDLKPLLFSFAVLLGLVFAVADSQAQTLLRWKFKPGDELHVVVEQSTDTETRAGIRPVKMSINMTMEMDWKVDAVEQDTATMTQQFSRIALKMSAASGDPIEFDSASKAAPTGINKEIAAGIVPLLGVEFQIKMNDRGEFLDVQLSPEADKALAGIPASSRLKEIFTQKGLTDLLRQTAAILPEQAVENGDDWKVDTKTKSPLGTITQTHEYQFKGSEAVDDATLEKITVRSSMNIERGAADSPKVKIKEHEQTGVLYFDAQAGRFANTTITQKLKTEMPYRDMTIRSSVESSMKMTITAGQKDNSDDAADASR